MSMSLAEFMAAKLGDVEPTGKETQFDDSGQSESKRLDAEEQVGEDEDWKEEEEEEDNEKNESLEDGEKDAVDEGTTSSQQPSETQASCSTCENPTEFLEYVRRVYGVDLTDKYKTDHAALQGLLEAYRLVGQRNQDSELVQYLRTKFGDEGLRRLLDDTAEAAELAQQQQPQQEEIEFDPAWLHMVQVDSQTGQLAPKPGVPQDVVDKLVKFAQHREKTLNEFAKNPDRFVAEKVGPYVQQAIQSAFQQIFHTTSKQAAVHQWIQSHAQLLYGPQGELSPYGDKIAKLASTLEMHGVSDPHDALLLAGSIIEQVQQAPPQPKTPSPAAAHTPNKKPKAPIPPRLAVKQLFEDHKKKGTPISLEAALRAAGLMSGEED